MKLLALSRVLLGLKNVHEFQASTPGRVSDPLLYPALNAPGYCQTPLRGVGAFRSVKSDGLPNSFTSSSPVFTALLADEGVIGLNECGTDGDEEEG
jgi:hypothetical protein